MTDFSDCQFISENMVFYTYYDFCDSKEAIKRMYNSLNKNAKLFYKWYVYANTHMEKHYKDAIWNFLNFDDTQYKERLLELKKNYRVR